MLVLPDRLPIHSVAHGRLGPQTVIHLLSSSAILYLGGNLLQPFSCTPVDIEVLCLPVNCVEVSRPCTPSRITGPPGEVGSRGSSNYSGVGWARPGLLGRFLSSVQALYPRQASPQCAEGGLGLPDVFCTNRHKQMHIFYEDVARA